MSSIFAINKAVNSAKGGGLPFYTNINKVFSAVNKGFNDTLGLWKVPYDKVPTFQLWLEQSTFVSITYLETTGGGVLTGTTFVPPVLLNTPQEVVDNGVTKWIYSSSDTGTPFYITPNGRWIIEFKVSNGGPATTYYSEEFITCENYYD